MSKAKKQSLSQYSSTGLPQRTIWLDALRTLVVASAVLGVGAAMIDTTYTTAAHPQTYYYGWVFLAVGFMLVVWAFAEYDMHPIWANFLLVAIGVYGWWNGTWSILDVMGGGQLDNKGGMVILANFGPLWPYNSGLIEVTFWVFVLSTLFAMLLPSCVYLILRRRTRSKSAQRRGSVSEWRA